MNGRDLCGERVVIELSRRGRDDRDRRRDHDRGNRRDRYGPPVQTRYRLTVENLSTRCSWQVSFLSFLSSSGLTLCAPKIWHRKPLYCII